MNKIKVAGALVFLLSLILALLSLSIMNQNNENLKELSFLNEQKALTQEISKSIFYTYRKGERTSKDIESMIHKYLENENCNRDEVTQNRLIENLWNSFYKDVEKFRKQQEVATGYNAVITAKLVNHIYHNNILLINAFNKLIEEQEFYYHRETDDYKRVQSILFMILIALLLYLFTQIRVIMKFIQKFSKTSKNIIENSTIKGVEPINLKAIKGDLEEANKNYNHLLKKIENSIQISTESMEYSSKSLEDVAQNIEDFMELLSKMNEENLEEMFAKEDAVIDSLEVLMSLQKRLKSLKKELNTLVVSVTPNIKKS